MRLVAMVGVMALGVMAGVPERPMAAPKTSNPGVVVTFGDRDGDKIVSDGHGTYVHGVGGVSAELWVSGSGDVTLNLGNTRPNRVFNGVYEPATDVTQPTTNPPSGTFSDGRSLNVPRIWQIPVGATETRGSAFGARIGSFRWCLEPSHCGGLGTELVTVTRTSFSTWTATADAETPTSIGSDLNVLLRSPQWTAIGYYRMPFQLTIQCKTSACD